MAMVNPIQLTVANPNVKDSRWLTLEVCREFQRSKCTRTENECKFAHPPPHVEVQNGRVIACFDSIKGKCQRKEPPCKYLHPPQHLREQLLQNGRNNLILKNLQMQAMQSHIIPTMPMSAGMFQVAGGKAMAYPTVIPGQYSVVAPPYLSSAAPTSAVAASYPFSLNASMQTVAAMPGSGSEQSVVPQQVHVPAQLQSGQQKVQRADRLEVCREYQRGTCSRQPYECRFAHPPDNVTVDSNDNHVTVCMDFIKGKCTRDSCRYFHPPAHLQAQIKAAQQRASAAAASAQALPPMVEVYTGKKRPRDPTEDLVLSVPGVAVPAYKRMAVGDSKSGLPMYQPQPYPQAATLMQVPYIPVSYGGELMNTSIGAVQTPVSMPVSTRMTYTYAPSTDMYVAGHPPSVPRF